MTTWIILALEQDGRPIWVRPSSIVRMARSADSKRTTIVQAGITLSDTAFLAVRETPEQIAQLIRDTENSR